MTALLGLNHRTISTVMTNHKNRLYRHQINTISHGILDLQDYQDKVLLLVNTASQCGFTPQYEGLEKLYQNYSKLGLCIIGFPCNQFGLQEPGNSDDIQEFCSLHYDVSFPLSEKIKVNGSQAHPLYMDLKAFSPGLFRSQKIKWNFTKFLVGPQAKVIKRFGPLTTPEKLEKLIQSLLL